MTEALARLTAKTQRFETIPGGVPVLAGCEAAAALSGLPRGAYLLGRLAYIGDDSVAQELQQIVLAQASKYFRKDDIAYPGFLRELCDAAIWDVCKPPRCPRCKGTRYAPSVTGATRACDLCKGLGLVHMGTKRACATFGIGRVRWKKLQPQYQRLEMLLWSWDAHVRGRVRRRLRPV